MDFPEDAEYRFRQPWNAMRLTSITPIRFHELIECGPERMNNYSVIILKRILLLWPSTIGRFELGFCPFSTGQPEPRKWPANQAASRHSVSARAYDLTLALLLSGRRNENLGSQIF